MTAGRPAKPTQLKVLQGNPGKRALNKNEPKPKAADPLRVPSWLSPDARKVWRERAPIIHEQGLLTEMDVELFAHACAQVAIARRDPHNTKALDVAQRILARFGMTPSDRAKIVVQPKTEDPFDAFLAKKA